MKLGVARGAISLGATRVITNIAGMLSIIVLARLLSAEDFGIVAIATTVLGIVVAVTELSLGSALIQREKVTPELIDSAWSIALIRTLIIVVFFLLAAYPLSILYDDPRLIPVFMVAGLTGALSGFFNPHVPLRTKQMEFRPLMAVQVTQKGVGLAIGIGIAIWLQNYWAIIIGNAIGAAVATLLSYIIVPYRPRFTLAQASSFTSFSGWLFLGQITSVLNWRFDQLLIGLVLPKAQLGAYAVADNLSAIPTRETTAPLAQALFPGFANMSNDLPRIRRAYLTAQATMALIALPAGIGLALLAEPLVALALGQKWIMIVPLIQIISCCYAIQTLTTGFRPLAMALGETRILFGRDLLGLLFRAVCVVIGLLADGLMGLVWGRAVSTVIGILLAFELVRRLTGIGLLQQITVHARTFAAIFAMVAAVLAARPFVQSGGPIYELLIEIGLLASLGMFTYVVTLGVLWQFAGRCSGPESELLGLGRKILFRR
jgi:O-antigen/teichoic acid export membrane protein